MLLFAPANSGKMANLMASRTVTSFVISMLDSEHSHPCVVLLHILDISVAFLVVPVVVGLWNAAMTSDSPRIDIFEQFFLVPLLLYFPMGS